MGPDDDWQEDDEASERAGAAALEALAGGPKTLADLTRDLLALGVLDPWITDDMDGDEVEDLVDEILLDTDGTWLVRQHDPCLVGDLARLVDGTSFTHRVSESELRRGVLDVNPDLTALDADDHELEVAGGVARVAMPGDGHGADDEGSLVGPPGWLDHVAPDSLVVVRRTGTSIAVATVDEGSLGEGEDELAALRVATRFDRWGELSTEVAELLYDALVIGAFTGRPTFRYPVPPVDELLERAGIERRGAFVGPAGKHWTSRLDDAMEREAERAAARWDLTGGATTRLVAMAAGLVQGSPIPSPDDDRWADPGVVVALADALVRLGRADEAVAVEEALGRVDPPSPAVAASILAARSLLLQASGRVLEGAALAEEAERADPTSPVAAAVLADVVDDQGDARRAEALLRRAGAEGEQAQTRLAGLAAMAQPGFAGTGRNEPCPCGSGRKHKQCCQRLPRTPLSRRKGWIVSKLLRWALWRHDARLEVVHSMSGIDPHPLVIDALLLELAPEFLAERGPLLPEDERTAMDAWVGRRVRLLEVIELRSGRAIVRDTSTGERLEVHEHLQSDPGELLLAHLVPLAGEERVVTVSLRVPLQYRETAIQLVDGPGGAVDVAQLVAVMSAPPRLMTPDGEELVLGQDLDEWPDLDDDGDGSDGPADLDDPAVQAMVQEYIRDYERKWIDESVPALGGLTPRQALDDPTRREDLLALLREMSHSAERFSGQGMDAGHVRALLGLDA